MADQSNDILPPNSGSGLFQNQDPSTMDPVAAKVTQANQQRQAAGESPVQSAPTAGATPSPLAGSPTAPGGIDKDTLHAILAKIPNSAAPTGPQAAVPTQGQQPLLGPINDQAVARIQSSKPAQPAVPAQSASPAQVAAPAQSNIKADRQSLADIVSKANNMPAPESAESLFAKLDQEQAKIPSPEDRTDWNQRLGDLKDVYNKARERNQWAEVAERIGQGLVQLGASAYGLAHHVDLSGIKFDKTNWDKKNDQLLDNLKEDVGIVKEERLGEQENISEQFKGQQEQLKEKKDILKAGWLEQFKTYQEGLLNARKAAADQYKDDVMNARNDRQHQDAENKIQLTAANNSLKDIQPKAQAIDSAMSDLDNLANGNLTTTTGGKRQTLDRKAAWTQISSKLAAAGVPQDSIAEAYKKANEPFFGMDWNAAKTVLQPHADLSRAMVKNLQQRRDSLANGGGQAAPAQLGNTPSGGGGMVKVINPQGQVGNIPAEQLQEALKAGFKQAQ